MSERAPIRESWSSPRRDADLFRSAGHNEQPGSKGGPCDVMFVPDLAVKPNPSHSPCPWPLGLGSRCICPWPGCTRGVWTSQVAMGEVSSPSFSLSLILCIPHPLSFSSFADSPWVCPTLGELLCELWLRSRPVKCGEDCPRWDHFSRFFFSVKRT